jgi:A/G-specific adenine glycosylase
MNFNDELLHWYKHNKRELPWRDTNDAYIIWLSEIILQQTRVEQGKPYFYRFLEKYPDVHHFAAAEEEEILKLWQGLGYYSRGRNMLKTAKMIAEEYDGIFPNNYEQLIKLKGIGAYTAAAIASFSANEAKAVVDGNVYRVLARYFGINEPINSRQGKQIFQAAANDLLNKQAPAQHNQAMMEFGALLCRPKNPACGVCPLRDGCYAFLNNLVAVLPVKLNTVKIRERYFNYFLITENENLLMNRRDDKDIWANMYDLPLFETGGMVSITEMITSAAVQEYFGADIKIEEISDVKKHILTHQRLFVRFIKVQTKPIKLKPGWLYTSIENLEKLALPKVIFVFLKNIFNF